MYAEFFGLRELPFNNTPDPRFFYSTPDHEEALASLIYAVKEKKGFVLLTGEVGAGKTLVSRLMIKHFAGTIAFANINHAIRDSGDLIESMCAEFELPHAKEDSNAHRVRTLHDFLLAKFAQNIPVVLVLDEAQNLSVDAFEQLRMIGNLEADDAKLLQIVIVGQPELQTLFQSAMLRQLRQRLFRSFHLPALDGANVEGYIRHRLTVAGASDPGLFGSEGAAAVHRASRGLPRLINTLCDNVMLSAYSAGRRTLDVPFIESVLATFADTPQRPSVATPPSTPPVTRTMPKAPPAAPAPAQRPDQTDELIRAGERASQLVARLETSVQRGADLAHELAGASERAMKTQQALAQREHQLTSLVQAVKTSAAHLAPMLTELNSATRSGTKAIAEAREAAQQLELHQSKSQALIHRLDDKIHQARLAAVAAPALNQPTPAPVETKVADLRPKKDRVPAALESNAPSPKQAVVRQSSIEKLAVVTPEIDEAVSNFTHPAMRLAHRMESLAALVQDAVAACTPPRKR